MQLKKVYSSIIPFKGYLAMTVWPFIFIRKESRDRFTPVVERHETIHAWQQIECLWVFFLLIYGLEYIIKLPVCGFSHKRAYKSISFEQEANAFEEVEYYDRIRRHYDWMHYMFTVVGE